EARHRQVLMQGVKSLAIAAPLSLLGSLAAQRYVGLYRGLSLPFKTFIGLMIPTGTFFTVVDRAAMHADLELSLRYSVSRKEDLQKIVQEPSEQTWQSTLFKHRYSIIGFGWLASLGATLLYNWKRRDIATAHKIINARMTAQTFALLGVGAIAGLATVTEPRREIDPHFERIVHASSRSSS
ncbi:hypothetical protein BC832DRAFT_516811, partial [Gaertneriomyces semiglobifer]